MKFEIYQGGDRFWYWRIIARNGRTIADGAEGYDSAGNCRRAIRRLQGLDFWCSGALIVVKL